MKTFEELEQTAHALSAQISNAESRDAKDELLKLKREYYLVKLDMLDMVDDSLVESQSVSALQIGRAHV